MSDLVDEPDLTAFHTPYEGDGRRNACEPRMMVKVLPYGYATGVFPSRGIAGRPEEDVAFRVSGAGNLPSHRTLCGFRRRQALGGLQGSVCGGGAGGAQDGVGALREAVGGRDEGACERKQTQGYGRMLRRERELEAEIEALPGRARDTDAREDERFGEAFRGDELPEGCAAAGSGWRRSGRRRRIWRRSSARPTMRADASLDGSAIRRAAGLTGVPAESRTGRRGATSPTPMAPS